jgi:hypothetical protein
MQKPVCYLCKGEVDLSDLTVREIVKTTRHFAGDTSGEASGCGCVGCIPGIVLGGGGGSAGKKEEEREKQPFHKKCWRRYEGKPGCIIGLLSAVAQVVLLLILLYLLYVLVAFLFF